MAKKKGRPTKAELMQREEERERIVAANTQHEAEFAIRLLAQMQRYSLHQVTRDQAFDLMQEIGDPEYWIFSIREYIGAFLVALSRHHGWKMSPESVRLADCPPSIDFQEWLFEQLTFVPPVGE